MANEDEDLEAIWADIRPVRPRAEVPKPVALPSKAERSRMALRALLEQQDLAGYHPDRSPRGGEVSVQIGLFTELGEVSANGYARGPARMHVGENLHIHEAVFPAANESWGTVVAVGIFFPNGMTLFVDLARAISVAKGDSVRVDNIMVTTGASSGARTERAEREGPWTGALDRITDDLLWVETRP